jgi:hypothetical protein
MLLRLSTDAQERERRHSVNKPQIPGFGSASELNVSRTVP